MTPFVASVTHAASAAVVALDALLAVLFALVILHPDNPAIAFVGRRAIPLAFAATAIALLGSIFYSEVAGFDPCILCYIQRAIVGLQAILLGYALRRPLQRILDAALAASGIGMAVAAYNQYLQFGGPSFLPCPSDATGASSCAKLFFVEFGYVTIPMMSFTAFAAIAFALIARRIGKAR
jgi:disulfide bond formation protein DsbB